MPPTKTKSKADKNLFRIVTPEFRVSYPHVFKAQAPNPKDTPKFSITMLFPKNVKLIGQSPEGKPRSIDQVIRNAALEAYGAEDQWPDPMLTPKVDGDLAKHANKEGYKGHWAYKATSSADQKPQVVDNEMNIITEPSVLYPGCYARAYIFARPYEYMGNQGIHFILDHVQKLRDGKSFGGKKPIEQVFSPVASVDNDESDEDAEADFL